MKQWEPACRSYSELTLVALVERLDIAWSRLLRRSRPPGLLARFGFLVSEVCAVCEARWRASRGIRHGVCAAGIDRASHRYADEQAAKRAATTG